MLKNALVKFETSVCLRVYCMQQLENVLAIFHIFKSLDFTKISRHITLLSDISLQHRRHFAHEVLICFARPGSDLVRKLTLRTR
jgi:hypothetical protein